MSLQKIVLRTVAWIAVVLPVATASAGIPGQPDVVPAATLIVPFFETGIDGGVNPHDTLLVVTNNTGGNVRVHSTYWAVDGTAVAFRNDLVGPRGTLALSIRDLLSTASQGIRDAFTEGDFFRGFVTFDTVTADTSASPYDPAYPFATTNALTGWVYYTRLSEGSANGLPMIHLEHVGGAISEFLRDIYQPGVDGREEIDISARLCAANRVATNSGTVPACSGSDDLIEELDYRVFLGGPLNGESRVVIFAWTRGEVGGPSALCPMAGCATTYPFQHHDEAGGLVLNTTVTLDDVVTVVDVPGSANGYIRLRNVPDLFDDTQVYGFVFNSANPGSAALTWDAIFEATIDP
jgi:hypothetical protein